MNLYPFGKAVTSVYIRILFHMQYEGLENVPRDRGFIIASNHRSFYDALFMAHKVKKQLNFMAKSSFFDNRFVGWLFRSLGAFPVQRDRSDRSALLKAKEFIEKGNVLAMFPEGTRSKDGNPMRAKPGVAMIAGMVGCSVLPVGISYKGKLSFRKRVTVRYGELLTPEKLGISTDSTRTIRKASHMIMDAIVAHMDRDCYERYGGDASEKGGREDAG